MNPIFPPYHTLGFACMFTLPAAGCGPAFPPAGNQGAAPQLLSLPGCVPTHTIATVCTQIGCQPYMSLPGCVPHTMWFICPPVNQAGGAQNTTATVCTQIGCQPHISLPGCVYTGICPPPANGGGGQLQPQQISFGIACAAPANAGNAPAPAVASSTSFCTGAVCHAPAQPDAAGPQFNSTQFHSCPPCNAAPAIGQAQNLLSAPTQCPTVAPMCPPAYGGGGQAQAQTKTGSWMCPPAYGSGQATPIHATTYTQPFGQCLVSAATQCPTVPPMCLPPAGQAQPQLTGSLITCNSLIIACTIFDSCGAPQAGVQPTQAQPQRFSVPPHCPTVPPMCPPANGGAQAQVSNHTAILLNCGSGITTTTTFGGHTQNMWPTQPGFCLLSAPPQCPTVWPTQPGTCFFTAPPQCGTTIHICTGVDSTNGGSQGQPGPLGSAATHCPTVPPMCPATSFNCPPHLLSTPPNCPRQSANANDGGQAQPQAPTTTIFLTHLGHCLSVPTYCPTVAPMCPPYHGGQGPQPGTIVSAYTYCPTVPPMCQPTAPPTCQQPLLSAPTQCPTVAPMCPPPAGQGGGQAQAQGFTILGICPDTISPVLCILTRVAGCGS